MSDDGVHARIRLFPLEFAPSFGEIGEALPPSLASKWEASRGGSDEKPAGESPDKVAQGNAGACLQKATQTPGRRESRD